ncbi:thiamine-phosphate kinase [Kineosporia babensis]|uniref:Thiamine-monophosphate kinase n=1 Tax=Kineosporia babensis TaxID=499548 RepID=A0A9X1SV99_9ACTN|nr:thiamine-phosphate kinase [Kineosporia babensis]MCD5313752.1 thiamine-phosphate kinase [Kineosporia babensis]
MGTSGDLPDGFGPTIGTLGEDPLVAGVIERYPSAPWLTVGPGDDAAVLDLSGSRAGALIACTDTIVEGQDFRRDWSTARDIGIKVAAQNFADVAAMGGRPHTLLVSLTTPADVPASWAHELADGLAAECSRAGAVVAGGDVSAGTEIVIVGTALGSLATPSAVLRSGARPGDVVAVTPGSGRSAAGWALLRAGLVSSAFEGLLSEHRAPVPPYPAGVEAALAGATAMIDTSDGLVRDALRIATASSAVLGSSVVLDLDPGALAASDDLLRAASALGVDAAAAAEWVLTGGEDHCLLACFPSPAVVPAAFRVIGSVLAGDSGVGVRLGGKPFDGEGGFRHWS